MEPRWLTATIVVELPADIRRFAVSQMKCEGKDRAPCRRCRQAGVECTFEAALPAPVGSRKGAAASKEWIESSVAPSHGLRAEAEIILLIQPATSAGACLVSKRG